MSVFRQIRYSLIAACLLAMPICANAFNPFETVSDYNAIVFGNAYAEGGDTEGRLAVGGDFTAKWYSVGTAASANASMYSLVVGGNLDAHGKWQVFNGNTAYGGKLVKSPSMDPAYTIVNTSGVVDFAAIKAQMQTVSSYLSSLAGNGIAEYDGYSTVNLVGNNTTLNVFNLTQEQAEKWASVNSRVISVPAGSTVIINVCGENASLHYGLTLEGVSSTNVIYNYYEATSLSITSMALEGSLLAPNASLSLISANVNGIAVVNESSQIYGGEYHNKEFSGDVPSTQALPEPSGLVLGAMGFGILIPYMRRKRHA